jgi:hypothetical protein
MEKGAPPTNIWQNKLSLEPFNAEDWKVRRVPAPTEPVLVIVSVGLAVTPKSHPSPKNGDATASTSCGVNPISKA